MAEREWPEEAREHFERGYEAQMAGRLEEAASCFQRAIDHGDDPELNRYFLAAVNGKA